MSTPYKQEYKSEYKKILCLYIVGMILLVTHRMFDDFKKAITKEFQMTDIGEMLYFLGVEISNQRRTYLSHRLDIPMKLLRYLK